MVLPICKFTQRFPFFLALMKVECESIWSRLIYFQKAKQIIRNCVYDVLLWFPRILAICDWKSSVIWWPATNLRGIFFVGSLIPCWYSSFEILFEKSCSEKWAKTYADYWGPCLTRGALLKVCKQLKKVLCTRSIMHLCPYWLEPKNRDRWIIFSFSYFYLPFYRKILKNPHGSKVLCR